MSYDEPMGPPACPSSDERVVLFGLLAETNARLERRLGLALEAACDTPLAWYEVLLQLHRSPEGRLKMSQVADAIVHSSGGTTRLVDRMEESGLVERQVCRSDRRAVYVAITAAGEERLSAALAVHLDYVERDLVARLDDSERATLAALLGKLNAPA
jgi:DNA-binding MarR family transcriptional regulator